MNFREVHDDNKFELPPLKVPFLQSETLRFNQIDTSDKTATEAP